MRGTTEYRFVEENNNSLVRAYVGRMRMDTYAHLKVLRHLYEKLRLYHNIFQPVLRLQEKIYTNELQYRRIFDQARTPFDRLKEKIVLSQTTQSQLENLRKQTNPLALRK